jgi:phage shock protein C
MHGKLTRSRSGQMLGGVCGGLANYLGVDATLVRLVFVLLALGNGAGVLVYLVLWMVLPREDRPAGTGAEETITANANEIADRARTLGDEVRGMADTPNPKAAMFFGAALIGLGVIFLLENLHWLWWFRMDVLWPALLILAGLLLIWSRLKGK